MGLENFVLWQRLRFSSFIGGVTTQNFELVSSTVLMFIGFKQTITKYA